MTNIQFSNIEVRLQTFFSIMFPNLVRFQWYILLSILIFIVKIKTNGIESDTECIKLSYPLILPVCTDRICTSTFKLTQMDLIVFWKQVYNAGILPLLPIIPRIFFFFFLRWKVKSFYEIIKNTRPSAMFINGKLCYKVSYIKSKMVRYFQSRI